MVEEFYDYKTAPVDGDQVVDLHRTGMSFYDDFLSNDIKTLDYLRNSKNLKGEVVMMSPDEYYQACSDYGFPGSHPSIESLKKNRRRDEKILQHLKNVLTIYKHRFPMPVLNKAEAGQEGLHRMMVIGDMFGWDHKVPVLVVDWADEDLAKQNKHRKYVEKIKYRIQQAVQETLRYKFANIEELRQQLQWELDRTLEYVEGIDIPVKFKLEEDGRYGVFVVTVGEASYEFDYEDVKFVEVEENDDFEISEDDIDIDDIDLEDIEDFLVRHFGDDWRTTHPHLKDTFNIKESVDNSDKQQIDRMIIKQWGQDIPGEGCIFIHPDGKFINIYPKLDDHEDLCYWVKEQGFENIVEDAEWFVDEFDYIRCRNSSHLCYIELPLKPITRKQIYALEEWLTTRVTCDNIQLHILNGEWNKYNVNEYFPEDIIKIIKRFYSSGKLYEKLTKKFTKN